MIDPSVQGFFTKGGNEYETLYRLDHSPRIRALLDRYDLVNQLKGKQIVDVGGGQGFLGEMLDSSTDYWVIDGADVPPEKRVCKGHWTTLDLDHAGFSSPYSSGIDGALPHPRQFDAAFFLETIEHLQSPYHAVVQLKEIVKRDGFIYISTPTETVWHNTPYPSLFWPPQSFVQWLGQMALQVVDFYTYEPKERGWPAYQYTCLNRDWIHAQMLYPKQESKFQGKKPHEYANL